MFYEQYRQRALLASQLQALFLLMALFVLLVLASPVCAKPISEALISKTIFNALQLPAKDLGFEIPRVSTPSLLSASHTENASALLVAEIVSRHIHN